MNYRRLGKAGLTVSQISLGSWLSCSDLSAKEAAIKIIHQAIACGVNFFDTADAYANGKAELILGEALRGFPRNSYVLATKVYWPTGPGPNDRGLSRRHILKQIDQSLKRLGTDYVDIYYCHWFDVETPLEETFKALDDIVRRGKARYIGVSNWTAAQMGAGLDVCGRFRLERIAVNQPSYNLFDRYIEKETIPFCEKNGIGLVVYSPLAQGVLTGKYRPGKPYPAGSRAANKNAAAEVTVWDYLHDEILAKVEKLITIAGELEITLSQLALAWVLRQPGVSSALIGASKPTQVEENVKAAGVRLPDEVLARIDKIVNAGSYTVKHNVVV